MKKKRFQLKRETLRKLTGPGLQRALGRGSTVRTDTDCDTIIDTQDSVCGCAGTNLCSIACGTVTDPGCGASCELIPC